MTGVQTCALPIYQRERLEEEASERADELERAKAQLTEREAQLLQQLSTLKDALKAKDNEHSNLEHIL